MITLALIFLIQIDDLTTKEHKISDLQVYRIELDHRGLNSLSERLAKGYSLGKFVPIDKGEKASEKKKVGLTEFHGHLAQQMSSIGAEITRLANATLTRATETQLKNLTDLRNDAIHNQIHLNPGSEPVQIESVERSWDAFKFCVKTAENYLFEVKGNGSVLECLNLIPENSLPPNFKSNHRKPSSELILLFNDLIKFEVDDQIWILPAFDRNFPAELGIAARELWVGMRYLRSKGVTLDEALAQVVEQLPSFQSEPTIRIPFVDRDPVRKDFCERWTNLVRTESKQIIERTDLCKV